MTLTSLLMRHGCNTAVLDELVYCSIVAGVGLVTLVMGLSATLVSVVDEARSRLSRICAIPYTIALLLCGLIVLIFPSLTSKTMWGLGAWCIVLILTSLVCSYMVLRILRAHNPDEHVEVVYDVAVEAA